MDKLRLMTPVIILNIEKIHHQVGSLSTGIEFILATIAQDNFTTGNV
jgi:hypothetical protein